MKTGKIETKKNNISIREKIIASVGKYPQYPHALYDAYGGSLRSRAAFRALLSEMQADGEIRINANNLVVLPKPPPATKPSHTQPPAPTSIENRPNEILIHCLVNRSRTLLNPADKNLMDRNAYYAHRNYKIEIIPLNSVVEETLRKGHQLVPGTFQWLDKHTQKVDGNIIGKKISVKNGNLISEKKSSDHTGALKEGETKKESIIKDGQAWLAQQFFIVEYDDIPEKTIPDFIEARPFIQENAWSITESIRSRYDDPDDEKCNGELRLKVGLCLPREIKTRKEREWVYEALKKEMPGCDDGSANSITNGGLGRAGAEFVKFGKIVDTDWFNNAIAAGKKAEREKQQAREQTEQERKRKQAERAAMGFTEREGELPLEALAKSDPSLFLESIGLAPKGNSGQYQRWGRPEKQGDTALSIRRSDRGNWQITVFANSISIPPDAFAGKSMSFARFYCYHEFHIDIEELQPDSTQWKDINAQLASRSYGTWLSDDEFREKHATPVSVSRNLNDIRGIDPVTPLPPDHPILISAPQVEVHETPSFRHFSKEESILLKSQGLDPDAGWNGATPIWTPKFEYLHRLTGHFALNGQPSETERHRVWYTDFRRCDCGGRRAVNINRYLLIVSEYCEKCHREFPITSYLEYELRRKLKHSITSECGGYLGNDPEFAYFCREMGLWSPGMITHLASAMNTGKTTEIVTAMRIFREQHSMHRAILIVPRISLALFLGYQLRSIEGSEAWGVYYEGSGREAFIGTHGAICCLPSLPRVIKDAEIHGLKPEHLRLAIDEVDFSYLLFQVVPSLSVKIKETLRTAIETNGLVTAGQTEFTLALERFTAEIGAPNGCQAFYKAADPCENKVTIRITPNTENKHTAAIASTRRHIDAHLAEGKNVYGFPTTRRDSHILADAFKHLNPVVYNAYTKSDPRADAVLRKQKVTDTPLFLATSAAAVGLSIHDPRGVSEILLTLNRGQIDLSSGTQEGVRNRSRGDIGYNLVEYQLKLPLKPSETEPISLFHEKQKEILGGEKVNSESVKRAADVSALNSLADTQPVTFLTYHFEEVVNMKVSVETETIPPRPELNHVKVLRKESIENERKFTVERAKEILVGVELMTRNEIRSAGNKGELVPRPQEQLAHEYANHALQAVGFDDKLPAFQTVGGMETISPERKNAIERFAGKPLETACDLIESGIDFERLGKQRSGWLAVHCLEISEQIALLQAGSGVETTAFEYPVVLGAFLETLISACNQHHTSESLSEAVLAVLDTEYEDSRFDEMILNGALGLATYRAVKFLKFAEPIDRIEFARQFISENYPSRMMKSEDAYALIPHEHEPLILQSFQCWLEMKAYPPPDPLCCLSGEPLPDPNAEKKQRAREMRTKGAQLDEIAKVLGKNVATISRWCRNIKTDRKAKKEEARKLETLGSSKNDISDLLAIPYTTILRWLK